MGDLTANFSRKEFACNCGCGFDTVDFELLIGLQNYCDYLKIENQNKKVSIAINSGCRCVAKNAKDGGAKASKHLIGRASDIVVKIDKTQVPPKLVADYFNSAHPTFSTGVYNTFTHIDTRTGKPWRG